MAVAADAQPRAPIMLSFSANLVIALTVVFFGYAAILYYGADSASLHTILDTSVAVIAVLIALLLWDISRRSGDSWPLFLTISFAMLAIGELLHTAAVTGTLGMQATDAQLRAGTWGPPAHLLPIGLGAALLLRKHPRSFAWPFALGLTLLAIALVAIFVAIPRYVEPGFLSITRPSLIFVPLLWTAVGVAYWKYRDESEIARAIAVTAIIFVMGHIAMFFATSPSDTPSMLAHFDKVVGEGLLLFNLIQIGAADTARRRQVEEQLMELNRDLDVRVAERTVRLRESNERMHLLEEITRAIGRRQDMRSIFQVTVRTLEDRLPADFVCLCLHDRINQTLTVEHVGVSSMTLGRELGITERAEIGIDQNGLSRCVGGALVYEPDISAVDFPFPNRLARQGLRSLVLAPLPVEGKVFAVLVVARLREEGFLSTDSEFLRQLGEHIGLAAHQAQLRDRLQQAYDDLRETQEAVLAQERLRAIGQMASGIAHDINNAISPVAVYTQSLLESEPDLAPEVRDYLGIVGRVIKDVSATIARMRDFYRTEDGEGDLKPVQLNELVPQVVELTRARWSDMPQQRGIVITVATMLEADLPLVMGNATGLREAATNLIFNAVDAMPEGGTITIRTETVRPKNGGQVHVRLEVADKGCGMDEESRKRCLEPFFTTKGERGTGLGLAMVYGAAQRHKAQLDIDSAPGEGTRVRLEFAASKAGDAKEPARAPRDIRPLRLLLVDDDPAVLRSTAFVLKRDKHDITAVDGGHAAIDALRAAHKEGTAFDLVITDLGMPYVDGNQVASTVKELFPSTPVLLLTGWGRRMAGEEEAPAHIDFVLSKPPELNELRDIFANLPSASPAAARSSAGSA